MADIINPLVELAGPQSPAGAGSAAVVSYNLPEPTVCTGRHYVEMAFDPNYFSDKAKARTYRLPTQYDLAPAEGNLLSDVTVAMQQGFDSNLQYPGSSLDRHFPSFPAELKGRLKYSSGVALPNGVNPDGSPSYRSYSGVYLDDGGVPTLEGISTDLQTLTNVEVVAQMKADKGYRRLKINRNLAGELSYTFVPVPVTPTPRLAIVEEYRLASYLGNYGAGRTLRTLTLLPGEKTKITIKSYRRSTQTSQGTSSILDSLNTESAEDFENAVESEASDRQATARSDEWGVEAEVSGNWGTGSAKVSGGVAGSANSSREEFSKNVSKATDKHAAKASAKRDVKVEMSTETKTESGEETGTVREIQNINAGRTLNFVFRQLNQEYYSVLHLTDVRIAFANGMPETERLVPLSQLDNLLEEVIAEPKRAEVRSIILSQLEFVVDYQGNKLKAYEERDLIKTKVVNGVPTQIPIEKFLSFRKNLVSTYSDPITGASFSVPGVITAVTRNVMRTDGVIVETLVGAGNGLDAYSQELQTEAGRAQFLANESLAADLQIEQTRQRIVREGLAPEADAFALMFPPPPPAGTVP